MAYAADQVQPTAQYSPRTGSIIRFVWHHQAGTNDDSTIAMMVTGSKQLSATYTVSNDDPGGRGYSRITQVVPDEYRPWTSSSATADGRALTAEVANSTGDPDWGIADATHEACARLAAYAYVAHGVPLKRAIRLPGRWSSSASALMATPEGRVRVRVRGGPCCGPCARTGPTRWPTAKP